MGFGKDGVRPASTAVMSSPIHHRVFHRRGLALICTIALAIASVSACEGKTSITQLWSAPVPSTVGPMHKIVVIAMQMDEANRRALEDSLSSALYQHGVQALPGYKLFPSELPTTEKAMAAVDSIGADGILMAKFKGTQERVSYVPGYYAGGVWGYYGAYYSGYYSGYTQYDEYVNLETTLWDARAADTVVWSALTNTHNPSTGMALVESVTNRIVPAIANAGFIPPLVKTKD
jgi:hypothetical protein